MGGEGRGQGWVIDCCRPLLMHPAANGSVRARGRARRALRAGRRGIVARMDGECVRWAARGRLSQAVKMDLAVVEATRAPAERSVGQPIPLRASKARERWRGATGGMECDGSGGAWVGGESNRARAGGLNQG